MKKLITTFALSLIGVLSFAQIEGKWKTIDDETEKPKSIVEIWKKPDGKYYGKIVQLLSKPENANCVACKDDRKNKPLIGLEIIRGLKKEGNEFTGGTITDPKKGKTYKCTITRNGDKLNVRGYLGISMLGRDQTWYKVN
ncbi:DUF2147 domain-containing protein [Chryseobacterium sp. SC28]|uniref:DUF2147 domain-containing protein n=1 Tax=Chryseobacterium sp. SC28 TaxID=2268028 RepID=UPI000F654766|nr:DUF2147 domain-containing protein [Chryseobacterium sp. SC28]RRQ45389.1 DUF2147 domain-containing protein [Chryseobacterium sp. SC28]